MENNYLVGVRFGRLVVVSGEGRFKKCRCDCGKEKMIRTWNLTSGATNSCGCLSREHIRSGINRTHGATSDGKLEMEYWRWSSMKSRCYNPKNKAYPAYGGRGITVCDRWRDDYSAFLADMGRCPEGLLLDREDVNGNYEPGNCRWVSFADSIHNRRPSGIMVTVGDKTMNITSWAEELGVNAATLQGKYRKGLWPNAGGRTRVYDRRSILFNYDGRELSLADWAKEFGINYRTLYARISRGTPFELIAAGKAKWRTGNYRKKEAPCEPTGDCHE